MNKKRCQIHTGLPITCFTVPIVGNTELNLTIDEIYKCLCAKAEVIEILNDGKRIHLDFSNYDKNNQSETIIDVEYKENLTETIVNDISYNDESEAINIDKDIEVSEDVELSTTEINYVSEEESKEETSTTKNVTAASTVTNYQVASRNNNHKKSKNNHRK